MPELTPEDKARIYEEERVRAEARQHFEAQQEASPRQSSPPLDPAFGKCCLAGVGVLIVLGLLISALDRTPPNTSDLTDSYTASVMAETFVKKRLKSPSTAEFSPETEEKVTAGGHGSYTVKGWVDSQNSFGAKLRSNWTVQERFEGGDRWSAQSVVVDEP